jgi:hypothetical protein
MPQTVLNIYSLKLFGEYLIAVYHSQPIVYKDIVDTLVWLITVFSVFSLLCINIS